MKRILISGFILSFVLSFSQDKCIPERPSPQRLVNNLSKEFPDFISQSEKQTIESKLVQFSNETSNQIAIVITDDLCGYDANEYSTQLGQKWKVGQEKFDNGVVIMIKPSGGAGQRDAYITVGYGLEGVIPDITAKQILNNEMIPRLKEGKNYEALDAAITVLMALAINEYSYKDYANENENWLYFFIAIVLLLLILSFLFRKSKGYTVSSGRSGRYYGGNWGSSGWGSSSRGGGGFGGFGGGRFGGGGAGGKW